MRFFTFRLKGRFLEADRRPWVVLGSAMDRFASIGRRLSPFHWVYLGDHGGRRCRLEMQWGTPHVQRTPTGDLQRVALELREDYRTLLAEQGKNRKGEDWWAQPISEANPQISRLHIRLAEASLVQRWIETGPPESPQVIFIESRAVWKTVVKSAGGRVRAVGAIPSGEGWARGSCIHLGYLAAKIWQVLEFRWRFGKSFLRSFQTGSAAGSSWTVLITWTDPRELARCPWVDPYLGDLGKRFQGWGRPVLLVSQAGARVSLASFAQHMNRNGGACLPAYAALRLRDIVKRTWQSWTSYPIFCPHWPRIGRLETNCLVREDVRQLWRYPRLAENLLAHDMVAAWKQLGLQIDRVIFPYENHAWEKNLKRGLSEHFPEAVSVGYQHTSVPYLLMNYFPAPDCPQPHPDFVVANGRNSRRHLLRNGYDTARTLQGGALRFPHLLGRSNRPRECTFTRRVVAALPIDLAEGAELLLRFYQALRSVPGVDGIVKCHPDTPMRGVLRCLEWSSLPSDIRMFDGTLAKALDAAVAMVYSTSSACIEGLAAGLPLVHFVSSVTPDRDPLEEYPDARQVADSSENLSRALAEVFSGGCSPLPEKKSRLILQDLYGCMDDAAYEQFAVSSLRLVSGEGEMK